MAVSHLSKHKLCKFQYFHKGSLYLHTTHNNVHNRKILSKEIKKCHVIIILKIQMLQNVQNDGKNKLFGRKGELGIGNKIMP